MNTQTNWLINTNLSVDCRILRIVEFDLELLDSSTSLLYEHELQKPLRCKIPILQVGWRFKLIQYSLNSQYCFRNWMKSLRRQGYIHLFLPYKNSNSSSMTQYRIRLLNKNNQWKITLLSYISLYATVIVYLQRYRLQWRKISWSKKKTIKVQNRYQ